MRAHGSYGLRSNLRTFEQLDDQSAYAVHAYAEVQAGRIVEDAWTSVSGAYSVPWNKLFDGKPLDVSGITTLTETLTRVETLAACQATAGTYYFEWSDTVVSPTGFDWQDWGFDQEMNFDDGAELYVHLTGGADPAATTVMVLTTHGFWSGAEAAWYFGSGFDGTSTGPVASGLSASFGIQPILGTNLMVDGGLEVWSSSTDLTNYAETLTGAGYTVTQATALTEGVYSARLAGTGAASGDATFRQNGVPLISGKPYRISIVYKTDLTNPSTSGLYVRLGTTDTMLEDGRNKETGLTNGVRLQDTNGQIRRMCFDVLSHEDTPRLAFRLINSAATACGAYIDDIRVQRIFGWRYYHPRLSMNGIPESAQAASDVYPGTEEVGSGTLQIANGSSAFCERLLSPETSGGWFFSSKKVQILFGGMFPDQQEVTYEDLLLGSTNIIRDFQVTDSYATFSLEEYRTVMDAVVPPRTWTLTDAPDVETRMIAQPRAMLFGYCENVRPTRKARDSTTGLGIYEITDPLYAPNTTSVLHTTAGAIGGVRAYEDEEAADAQDFARSVVLVLTTDYTVQAADATITLVKNPGPVRITADENDRLDFVSNAVTRVVSLTPGLYSWNQLKTHLNAVFDALLGAGVVVWSFSETSASLPYHKWSVNYTGAGTFQLLLGSGTNRDRSAYADLGYTGSADLTGATTYTADTAVAYDPDTTHIIRVDSEGYQDDASGTYTGSANALISVGPDILTVLLRKVLRFPASQINTSFISARSTCYQPLAVYLGTLAAVSGGSGSDLTIADVVDRLEASGYADIVLDGSGVFHYHYRSEPPPADVFATLVDLQDEDFIGTFEGSINAGDAYGNVRLNYKQSPSTANVLGVERRQNSTILVQGRPQTRVFDTYLKDLETANLAIDRLAFLCIAPTRHFHFFVHGRLLRHKVGDVVRLTRSQGLLGTGETSLTLRIFRILSIRKNFLNHVCEVICHTNIATT